jgi:drug/metabolite transporter (DMT)-like permease
MSGHHTTTEADNSHNPIHVNSSLQSGGVEEEDESASPLTTFMISSLFMGVMGITNLVCSIWFIFIWNATGWESFEWPDALQTRALLITACCEGILNFSIAAGTSFTSPLVVVIGSLLVIPLSILFDIIAHSYFISPIEIVGVALIVFGFLFVILADNVPRWVYEEGVSEESGIAYYFFHEVRLGKRKAYSVPYEL